MKSTILLTTALFLMSAPSPDSKSVSEFSGGFLAETNDTGLMASDVDSGIRAGSGAAAQSFDRSALQVKPGEQVEVATALPEQSKKN